MNPDLKIKLDSGVLNVRAGVIMHTPDKCVIEVSRVGLNSVLPGGRLKLGEDSRMALVREIGEEMGLSVESERLKRVDVLENIFEAGGTMYHEIYFLYECRISESEMLCVTGTDNLDNKTTHFVAASYEELEGYNLLPLCVFGYVKKEIG